MPEGQLDSVVLATAMGALFKIPKRDLEKYRVAPADRLNVVESDYQTFMSISPISGRVAAIEAWRWWVLHHYNNVF